MLRRFLAATFIFIMAMTVLLGLYLARHMPWRYLVLLLLLGVGLGLVEEVTRRALARRVADKPFLRGLLTLVFALVFVLSMYLFAVYLYPGVR